ncbi:MAG: hypothetical protein EBU81_12970, partial [Proteobacteria bacterium]|nr:hypothetical protein [Pseudomonadota bacterium]
MLDNGGFELPAVSAFQYSPTASSAVWTFENQAGVATKGDWFSVETPEGRQGAFFQNANSSARQGVLLNSGAYKVVFKAISRHVTPANPLQVYLTASSASIPVLVRSVAQSELSSSEWRIFES